MTLELYVISCGLCAGLGYLIASILFNRDLDRMHKERNKMVANIYESAEEYYKKRYEENLRELIGERKIEQATYIHKLKEKGERKNEG